MPIYNVTGQSAGKECSSTYEGRHLTILGSLLTSAGTVATTGLVKGEPVLFGNVGVGVAFISCTQALLASSYIAVDTEGIWWQNIVLTGSRNAGYAIYIVDATGVLRDTGGAGTRLFGYLATGGTTGTRLCAVKVHFGLQYVASQ